MSPLETDRLILRPVALADAPQVQVLFPRWEIVKYLLNVVPWPYPSDGAEVFFRSVVLPGMARDEYWYWTLRLKTAPEQIIGSVQLNAGFRISTGCASLAWRIAIMSAAAYPPRSGKYLRMSVG